jgi:CxxC motif-containing protein (DUF1111 family)
MDRTYRVWYFLVLLLALAPAGARLLFWDPFVARSIFLHPSWAQAGEALFMHDWRYNDPLCPEGDGLGPVYNATSCVACHHQGGPGGSGGLEHNVTTFTVRIPGQQPREGIVHAYHVGGDHLAETLLNVHSNLPDVPRPSLEDLSAFSRPNRIPRGVHVSQRNTPALFGSKLIDEIPEKSILAGAKSQRTRLGRTSADESVPVGRPLRLANGRIGRFGWKAQMASLSDFVQAACANELGLSNPGQAQPTPLYQKVSSRAPGLDLTTRQCDQLTAFCAALPRPMERVPQESALADLVEAGKHLFGAVGCADCHTPKLGSVEGIYSDLLLHRMGQILVGGGSYGGRPTPELDSKNEGPLADEWRTPPLWGVADSAPYLHDGRAATLAEAIRLHGGQAQSAARNFEALSGEDKVQLVVFLKTLRAP